MYAIKFNVDEGVISFSQSIRNEIKKWSTINFCYSRDGFSFFLSKKGRPTTKFRYKVDKVSKCIEDLELASDLAHSISLNNDWEEKYENGKLTISDKIVGKREYIICVEKLEDGCFKSLVTFNRRFKEKNSLNYGGLNIRINAGGGKDLVYFEDALKVGIYWNYSNVENLYAIKNPLTRARNNYSPSSIIGSRKNKNYYHKFTSLTPDYVEQIHFRDQSLREIPNNIICMEYLFEKMFVKDGEVFVSYLSYHRLLRLYYVDKVKINNELFYNSKRQEIKLTKYLQALYPKLTSEEISKKADALSFELRPIKPDIKIVKGDEIVHWYKEKNYYKFKSGGSELANSCMRHDSYTQRINFYAKNENCSMLVLLIGEKLIGRMLVWDCVDGTKLGDRPYTNRESEKLIINQYMKDNGIISLYDFKERCQGASAGFSPSNFKEHSKKYFEVKLTYIPEDWKKQNIRNKVPFTYCTTSCNDIPYLDNMVMFDLNSDIISNYRSVDTYCKSKPSEYKQYYDFWHHISDLVKTKNNKFIPTRFALFSKYYDAWLENNECYSYKGDFYLPEDCVKVNNTWIPKWEVKEPTAEKVIEVEKALSKIKVINNEELEYVQSLRFA